MTASPASVPTPMRRLIVPAMLLAMAWPAGSTHAQGPVRLAPLDPPPPAAGEQEAPPADVPQVESVPSVPGDSGSTIEVRGLEQVDADAVGLLSEGNGGLPTGMWTGTSRRDAVQLVQDLPVHSASATARDLARRLLVTIATPPDGEVGGTDLASARIAKLVEMGAFEDAENLLRAISSRRVPAQLAKGAVELRLLRADFAGACNIVTEHDAAYTDLFWQKALIFCQLLQQDRLQAGLGLDLLRESGEAQQDAMFFVLAGALAAGIEPDAGQLQTPGQVTPLNLALGRAARVSVPEWFVERGSPAIQRAVASSPAATLDVRLSAARAAAKASAMSAVELADVYTSLEISGEDIAAALLSPGELSAPRRLALSFLAARAQEVPLARAEALREMLRLATDQGDALLAFRLAGPLLDRLSVRPELAWFAADAARIAVATGDGAAALDWYLAAESEARLDDVHRPVVVAAWPLVRAAVGDGTPKAQPDPVDPIDMSQVGLSPDVTASVGVTVAPLQTTRLPWDPQRLADWIASRKETQTALSGAASGMLSVLEALGESVSPATWRLAASAPATQATFPGAPEWFGFERAAANTHTAETVLFALQVIGARPVAQIHPVALHRMVRTLTDAGFADAARALALEAALVYSL